MLQVIYLFNNTVKLHIDRFTTWPEEALEMVATSLLQDVQFDAPLLSQCAAACKYFHYSAKLLGNK